MTGTLTTTLGMLNPFRYRGYVWDEETGLYYLRSRYYNPEWGRFVNADNLVGKTGCLLSHNVFAYCRNDPISKSDSSGMIWQSIVSLWNSTASAVKVGFDKSVDWSRNTAWPAVRTGFNVSVDWSVNTAWPAIKSTTHKVAKSAESTFANIHITASFGAGFGFKHKVLGHGAELTIALNAIQLRTNPKIPAHGALPAGMELGWDFGTGVQIGPPILSAGTSIGSSTTAEGDLESEQVLDQMTLYSLGGYVGLGGAIDISIDEQWWLDMGNIWFN